MDCRTARLLLDFARPAAGELDPAEADVLHDHLANCPDCATQAQNERRLDHHLGQAVRRVEVPDGLCGRLLERLAADRRDWYRRWVRHGLRAAAVAAALLLGLGSWWYWHGNRLPGVNFEAALADANSRRTLEEVQAGFQRLGVDVVLPDDLDYNYLSHFGVAELPGHEGKKLPFLAFHRGAEHARVYIVPAKQFDLESLNEPAPNRSGDQYRLEVRRPEGVACAYLIFYTGGSTDWLRPPTSTT